VSYSFIPFFTFLQLYFWSNFPSFSYKIDVLCDFKVLTSIKSKILVKARVKLIFRVPSSKDSKPHDFQPFSYPFYRPISVQNIGIQAYFPFFCMGSYPGSYKTQFPVKWSKKLKNLIKWPTKSPLLLKKPLKSPYLFWKSSKIICVNHRLNEFLLGSPMEIDVFDENWVKSAVEITA
jgi:hypothetical protein